MKLSHLIFAFLCLCLCGTAGAQQAAPSFQVMNGDTVNVTDSQGRQQGVWRDIYAEGTLKRETTYKDGRKNGMDLTFWRVPNCMKEEAQYKNDTLNGYRIVYYRDCKIRLMETYKNGTLEGYVRKYHRNGQLMAEGLYKGGELQGFMKRYDEKGNEEDQSTPAVRNINLEGYVTQDVPITDSAILKSLSQFPLTGRTVIVTDVTGSMYAYVGQLLLWYKLNFGSTPVHQFIFFNDGDKKPDMTKRIGSTGGIYPSDPKQLLELKKNMEEAINNGNGGDPQENDLEGVLEGIKKFKKVDQVVLVADRTSPVRDIELLSKIKVPVNVILCGDPEYTNPQYLDIARATHGQLYTLDEELKDVQGVHDGEKIHIANLTYVFRAGKFHRVMQ